MPESTDDEEVVETEDVGVLDVSDEDFLSMEEPPKSDEKVEEEEDTSTKTDEKDVSDKEEDEGKTDEKIEEEDAKTTTNPDEKLESTDDVDEEDPEKDDKKKKEAKSEEDETDTIDYKAEYEKLMAPFKANGTEITPQSAEDLTKLAQMGANYHKKMAGLKPNLKILKLLENNDLLDTTKLNFLIDLNSKNPDAITKLLKDSDIDPLDVDTKEESTYTPTARTVSDTEVELDSVLEAIQDTPSYIQTLNVVTKQWDEQSRRVVANNPHIISTINAQITDGVYEKVASALAYSRSLGEFQGVSDLEAYQATGDRLFKEGKLGGAPAQQEVPAAKVKPKVDSVQEAERKKRKKAAGSTRTVSGTSSEATFDPLALSDEDFDKIDPTKYGL